MLTSKMKIVLCLVSLCIIELSCVLASPISENDVTENMDLSIGFTNNGGSLSTYYIPTAGIGTHKYHNQKKTWNDARTTCLNEGGHLVVINSAAEEALLVKYINITEKPPYDEFWIGIHELFKKDEWVSVKDERLDAIGYVHWSPNQPDNAGPGEHCLALKPLGMNDFICDELLPFVCEI